MRFVSLFTGVGGFDLGLEAAGFECVAQVERDLHCLEVLHRRWPEVPKWADVVKVDGAMLPVAEMVAFGSPCQDLSVAGHKAGFVEGGRSNLFFEAIRIVKEMCDAADATQSVRPRYVIWENVPHALRSNGGKDFGSVLDALAELGALDIGWRVLDARFFGVPQRRRRVFVVADLGGHNAGPVFADTSSSQWHPSARLTPWAHSSPRSARRTDVVVAGALTATGVGTCGADDNQAQARHLVAFSHTQGLDCQPSQTHWPTLRAGGGGHAVAISENQHGYVSERLYAPSQVTEGGKPGSGYSAARIGNMVRRLTPVECERLNGWPDDHTRWRVNGDEIADHIRYAMCGNGVAAPVAHWIGHRLMALHR
jgi:DNA (cytosine-5)-methyltransferase 1